MVAPRSLSRPQIQPRSTPQNQGGVARKKGEASKPASTKEAEAHEDVQEKEDPRHLKGHGKAQKKGGAKAKRQAGDEDALGQGVDAHGRNAPGFATGFDADEIEVQARSGVKTGAVSGTSTVLPHSPAALMFKLQAPIPGQAPRNKVNDLAKFAATEQVGDLDTFGAELQDLVEKVEAGAYQNRDLRIPLGKLEFPKDKEIFALFSEDTLESPGSRRETQGFTGARHALLDLMQRLSDGCGDAIILPSWPVRIKDLNALWQMQGATLLGDVDKAASWAKKLLTQTPEGPFSSFAKNQLKSFSTASESGGVETKAIESVQKALRPNGDVDKLCKGMKRLAARVENGAQSQQKKSSGLLETLSPAEVEKEISLLPDPAALDVTALWTNAGDALRLEFHQGLDALATHHPDLPIYEDQTLKEASMYANVLEHQYAVSEGRGKPADLLDVTQAFVEAFPSSERSQWITQLAAE
ncbi:MAG: hypothetical protein GY822_17670 [Deltaproteobacteria bacterium]|nr:hypothetical protein [Deltaproteobacteria bacterium]